MTYIDIIIEKKIENETAETYIENFKSLHLRSGILGSPEDKTRMLFRLLKFFERDHLLSDSTKLACFTDKDFDETEELIIKEDEKNRSAKGIKEDSNKVNFQDNTEPNITTMLRVNSNYEDNNIEASNPLKQNTMQYSKRNFSNNYTRENSPYSNKNNNYGNNKRNNYNNDNSNRGYDNYGQNNNNYNNNNNNSNYDNNKNNNDKRNREKSPNRQNFQNDTRSKSAEKHQSSDNNNKRQKLTHDESIQNRANIKCRNLAKGFCKYGDICNFSHSK